MRKTVLFILSTPYAGSHYLSLMLGSHSQALHLGEMKRVCLAENRPESRECTFHRGNILEGLGAKDTPHVYETIFARAEPQVQLLVDNTKRVRWAERFLTNPAYDRKFVHLIRDPRAIIRRYRMGSHFRKQLRERWKLFRKLPEVRAAIFFQRSDLVWLYAWLRQNQEITRFLTERRLEHIVVTYRDLARDPAAEIRRIMEWAGLPFELPQLEYWNFEHVGTEKRGYEWVKEKKVTFIDLRWQSDLPAEIRERVRRDRPTARYLSTLNLRMVDDGLTRLPELGAGPVPAAHTTA